MSLDTSTLNTLLGAVRDHAETLGLFENVELHEPKDAPGNGLTCAFWAGSGRPVPELSGLTSSSWRVEVHGRVYLNMLYEPQDAIDPLIMGALDALMTSYSGAFTLGGLVEEVDLLGNYGNPLEWQLQYATHNHKVFRIATITLPLVVADLYTQGV